MTTSPLLSNVRYKAITTTISPLRTKAVELVPKFQAPAPYIKNFWLQRLEAFASRSRTIGPKNQKKHCIICIIHLPNKLPLWIQNPNLWL